MVTERYGSVNRMYDGLLWSCCMCWRTAKPNVLPSINTALLPRDKGSTKRLIEVWYFIYLLKTETPLQLNILMVTFCHLCSDVIQYDHTLNFWPFWCFILNAKRSGVISAWLTFSWLLSNTLICRFVFLNERHQKCNRTTGWSFAFSGSISNFTSLKHTGVGQWNWNTGQCTVVLATFD